MWYKYVDRASYDIVRIWRYYWRDSDVAISSSTRTTMVFSRTNTLALSLSTSIVQFAAKDQ